MEIGWRLGRAHWGKGFVTAAALATLERLSAARVPEVAAVIDAENERSLAVARRIGMEPGERFVIPASLREAVCMRLPVAAGSTGGR